MISIQLQSGRSIYLTNFYYGRTYGGLLEGRPNPEINERILDRAMSRMELIWGKRKTHMIPPIFDTANPEHPSLPATELTGWFTCHEAIDSQFMGSELVLIWYVNDEQFNASSIKELATAALDQIVWCELAADFDW